jgi:hypothetical protein
VPDVLSNRTSVLFPDIARRELNIDHSGLYLRMPHELHQGWQADAGSDHVRSEGMPKLMRVRLRHARGLPVMTEQGTQTGWCHPVASRRPFETNE